MTESAPRTAGALSLLIAACGVSFLRGGIAEILFGVVLIGLGLSSTVFVLRAHHRWQARVGGLRVVASSTPRLDEVSLGVRVAMRGAVIIAGVAGAFFAMLLVVAVVGLLERIGLDKAIADTLLLLLSLVGVFPAAAGAAVAMERLQEGRLQALLAPEAEDTTALSAAQTSAAVPSRAARAVDVDKSET